VPKGGLRASRSAASRMRPGSQPPPGTRPSIRLQLVCAYRVATPCNSAEGLEDSENGQSPIVTARFHVRSSPAHDSANRSVLAPRIFVRQYFAVTF